MNAPKPPDQVRSKIGRLPFAHRMGFNRLVRDGLTSTALIAWLAKHGVPNVNPENIRKYKQSPAYKTWLREEMDIERDRVATEQTMRLAEALGGSASEKLKTILAGKLYQVMQSAGTPDRDTVGAIRAITEAERLELMRRQADQKDEALALDREKFNLQFAEGFLKFCQDAQARAIAESDQSHDHKIKAMLDYMKRQVED